MSSVPDNKKSIGKRRLAALLPLPLLPILVVSLLLFAPLLLSGKGLFWGTPGLQFVPWWDFASETVLTGELPLWNPFSGMGAPLIANYQSGIFYPPNWLYLVFHMFGGAPTIAWGSALVVIFHLVWAGMGMALLVRRLGMGVLSQTIAGLAFGFSGYLISRAGFFSINASAAWLPWVIFGLTPKQYGEKIRSTQLIGLVVVFGLQLLAGHAQTTWYTWLLAGAWTGFLAWNNFYGSPSSVESAYRRPLSGLRSVFLTWGRFGLILIIACGVTALQVLPTAEYLTQSHRSSAVDYELAMVYSFWPWRILTFFAPNLFGNPAHGDYWGYANYWEGDVYIGLLPLLLALAAMFRAIHRRSNVDPSGKVDRDLTAFVISQRMCGFLIVLLCATLILAMGEFSPLFPWLYRHVPTFDLFQAPARMMLWAEFALALLAAIGMQLWRRPQGRGLYWTRLGTAGAFAVALGSFLASALVGDVRSTLIGATALAGLWGVSAGLLSLTAPPADGHDDVWTSRPVRLHYVWWGYAVVLLVCVDLYLAGKGLNPGIDLEFYHPLSNQKEMQVMLEGQRLYLSSSDEQEMKFRRFLRFDTFHIQEDWMNLRRVMLPNLTLLDRLPSVNNFDPLLPDRYTRWMRYLDQASSGQRERLLSLMDVGIIESIDTVQPIGVSFDRFSEGERVRWVTCAWYVSDGEGAWEQMLEEETDFSTHVVLETEVRVSGEDCRSKAEQEVSPNIKLLVESPNQVVLSLHSQTSGWIVLSDLWYPGWLAILDGKATPILRANYLFRAVFVPDGEHEIEFQYQPWSFRLGLTISICVVAILIWFWRRSISKQNPQ